MRIEKSQPLANPEEYKTKLLLWAQQFTSQVWLDSNGHSNKYSRFDGVMAVGKHSEIKPENNCFEVLAKFKEDTKDWIFGYLTYDLKNELERLESNNRDELDFPLLHFFQPKKLFIIKDNYLTALYLKEYEYEMDDDLEAILNTDDSGFADSQCSPIKIKLRIFKDE